MNVYGSLNILGFLEGAFKPLDAYPTSPKVGSFAFIHKRFMVCGEIENSTPFWIPLTNEVDTYVHAQSIASSEWNIPHKLNFSTPIVQCYDGNNNVVNPNSISTVDADTIRVEFPEDVMGRAIVVVGDFAGVAKQPVSFSMDITEETSVVVPHGLGYAPRIIVISDGYEVQPKSIRHSPDFAHSTVEFNAALSGTIRVQ